MPLKLLTDHERKTFSAIPSDPDEPILRRYFVLRREDERLIRQARGPHNKLGLAHQLGWLRWLGRQPSLEEARACPTTITMYLGDQLNIRPDQFKTYPHDRDTWDNHRGLVRRHLGWRECGEVERQRLLIWLIEQAKEHDKPRGLLQDAVAFLRRESIVRPGLTTLERLIAQARTEAQGQIERDIHQRLLRPQLRELDALIATTGVGEPSRLTILLAPPPNATATSLNGILTKIQSLRAIGVEELDLSGLNPNRRKVLAREAERLTAFELRRLPPARRYTLLACAVWELLRRLNDEAVITHGQLLREMLQRSAGRRNKELLQKRSTINQAFKLLASIGEKLNDPTIADADLRRQIVPGLITQNNLETLLKDCQALIEPSEHNDLLYLNASYSTLRRFAPKFLATLSLRATERGLPDWKAIEFARQLEEDRQAKFIDPPMEIVPYKWRTLMTASNGQINRRLWEIALHLQLAESLKAGDIWVEHSGDFTPLEQDLNLPAEQVRDFQARNAHLISAQVFLRQRLAQYHETLRRANDLWPQLDDVRFEGDKLILSPLTALDEPEGTGAARSRLYGLMPKRKIAQLLREVQNWTDFLEPLREAAGDDVRVDHFDDRLLAVVLAEGCNIGLANMADSTPGVSYMQLARIANRCLAPEHIERAIAKVIDYFGKYVEIA